jgi:hypothetical protein
MTEFANETEPQFTPGTEGAVAPAPVQAELQIGVGALLGRLSAADAA